MTALFENVIIVSRKTQLDELVHRFNTIAQARFYLEQGGHSFADIQAAHDSHYRALEAVRHAIPKGVKSQVIDREMVPRFLFGDDDMVVTVGQDGLVSNTAKYLHGQPVFAVNPEPERYDGVLLPFVASDIARPLAQALSGRLAHEEVTLAEARSSNNQSLLAFNDFFIGARSHVSARYEIAVGGRRERQSSSGIIVSTGAGSTGWLQSVYAGAAGVIQALGGRVVPPPNGGRLPWNTDRLAFSVREPFPSQITQCSIVHGLFSADEPLQLTSNMAANGVIFSDGVEEDYLEFNAGTELTITTAAKRAKLLVPGART
ncbi:MAG: sugar kinase [Pseudomonadota bacterium]